MTITVASDLVYHLLGVGHSRPIQISNLYWLTPPTRAALHSLKVTLSDFPSAAAVNNTSATSAPPSAIIVQGRWHAPVEPFAVVALTTLSHWAGYSSLCQRQRDKCYNYVNSVQPECFSRWNIANWTAFWRILSALRSWMISPSKLRVHSFTHCFYHIAPLCVCLSMHMCIILKEWVPGAAFGFGKSSTPVTRLKGSHWSDLVQTELCV